MDQPHDVGLGGELRLDLRPLRLLVEHGQVPLEVELLLHQVQLLLRQRLPAVLVLQGEQVEVEQVEEKQVEVEQVGE